MCWWPLLAMHPSLCVKGTLLPEHLDPDALDSPAVEQGISGERGARDWHAVLSPNLEVLFSLHLAPSHPLLYVIWGGIRAVAVR